MGTDNPAKEALDAVIYKSHVHVHQPIQIAEILFHHRTGKRWNLSDLESCRKRLKRWHDDVSMLADRHHGTSSQQDQGNFFASNVIPTKLLAQLGTINKRNKGRIEAYIYKALEIRLSSVHEVYEYIHSSTADSFSLGMLVAFFQNKQELRCSISKIYEILVYALFTTIIRALKAKTTANIEGKDKKILKDFERFLSMGLGIDLKQRKFIFPDSLYQADKPNDTGRSLTMWANYGQAVQVKYLTLVQSLAEDTTDKITADKIIIVCLGIERKVIESFLWQIGFGKKLYGCITIDSLGDCYKLCLNKKYRDNLGANLLNDMQRKFTEAFPSSKEIVPFITKRGYDKIVMPSDWKIST